MRAVFLVRFGGVLVGFSRSLFSVELVWYMQKTLQKRGSVHAVRGTRTWAGKEQKTAVPEPTAAPRMSVSRDHVHRCRFMAGSAALSR